tara:strand:- start:114 stop:548 length:435 start_codon:yes stop_codon:yes gene_type:complete
MKKFLKYNTLTGKLHSIIYINESDKDLYYETNYTLSAVDNYSNISLDDNKINLSTNQISNKDDFPIVFNTLVQDITSTDFISISGIPSGTRFTLSNNLSNIIYTEIVNDGILEFELDTMDKGILYLNFKHQDYLSNKTHLLTAF